MTKTNTPADSCCEKATPGAVCNECAEASAAYSAAMAAPQASTTATAALRDLSDLERKDLIGSYFADDWAKEAAAGLLHDYAAAIAAFPADAAPQDEHRAFEDALRSIWTPGFVAHRNGDGYYEGRVQEMWSLWKFRAALPAQSVAHETPCVCSDEYGATCKTKYGPACLYGNSAPAAVAWVRPDLIADGKLLATTCSVHASHRQGYIPLVIAAPAQDVAPIDFEAAWQAADESKAAGEHKGVARYWFRQGQGVGPTDTRLRKIVETYFTNNVGENVYNQMSAARAELAVPPAVAQDVAPSDAQPLTLQDCLNEFDFLEGLVDQHTYIEIAQKAFEIAQKAPQPAARPADAQADMFWDADDTERNLMASSEEEAIREIADEASPRELPFKVVLQRAKALPDLRVRVTSLADKDGNGFTYEVVDAARTQGGADAQK